MFYAKDDEERVNWVLYFKSYHLDSWIGIFISFFVSSAIFALMVLISKWIHGEDFTRLSIFMAISFTALSQVLYNV